MMSRLKSLVLPLQDGIGQGSCGPVRVDDPSSRLHMRFHLQPAAYRRGGLCWGWHGVSSSPGVFSAVGT